jgi:hypothetical protein
LTTQYIKYQRGYLVDNLNSVAEVIFSVYYDNIPYLIERDMSLDQRWEYWDLSKEWQHMKCEAHVYLYWGQKEILIEDVMFTRNLNQ